MAKIKMPQRSEEIMAKLLEVSATIERVTCAAEGCRHGATWYPNGGYEMEKNPNGEGFRAVRWEIPKPSGEWYCSEHMANIPF